MYYFDYDYCLRQREINERESDFIHNLKNRGWAYFEQPSEITGMEFLFESRNETRCWHGSDKYKTYIVSRDTSLVFTRTNKMGNAINMVTMVYNDAMRQAFEYRGVLLVNGMMPTSTLLKATVHKLNELMEDADNILGKVLPGTLANEIFKPYVPPDKNTQERIWQTIERYGLGT